MGAMNGGGGGGNAMRQFRAPKKEQPELMDPTRERDGRRILRLFRPYRMRLMIVVVMIVCSAAISMINPFLVKRALDVGIVGKNDTVLTEMVIAMFVVALVTSAASVWQTYLSNVVGQRVMHDLRATVYKHLQKMSLAFFTRTRTGEVQSRISNDIGGLDNVITTTATTIAGNVTTVIAAVVAMCILNWRLALLSLFFVPPSVWMTRQVGKLRRRITGEQQRRLADMSALVAESLSVSGIMLGKTMGRGDNLADRFTAESGDIADLEVRSRMAGRWTMATIQFVFSVTPAIIYWFAGQKFARWHDHDRNGRGLHDAADAAAVPDPVAARRRCRHRGFAGAVRSDLRVHRSAGRHRRGRAPYRAGSFAGRGGGALRGRVVPL